MKKPEYGHKPIKNEKTGEAPTPEEVGELLIKIKILEEQVKKLKEKNENIINNIKSIFDES